MGLVRYFTIIACNIFLTAGIKQTVGISQLKKHAGYHKFLLIEPCGLPRIFLLYLQRVSLVSVG